MARINSKRLAEAGGYKIIMGDIPTFKNATCGHTVYADYDFCPRCGAMVDEPPDPTTVLLEALESIAANTCCNGCQEAALVARATLAKYRTQRKGVD